MKNRRELNAYLKEVLHTDGHLNDITHTTCQLANDFGDQYDLAEQTGTAIIAAIEAGLTCDKWKIKEGVATMETNHEHRLDDGRTFGVACITQLKRTPNGPERYALRVVMMGAYM